MRGSVPAGEFSQIDGYPPVMGEVKDRHFVEQSSRDWRGGESPRVGIAAEFEAGNEKAKTDGGLGAGDHWEPWEDVRCTRSRHCDPD